MTLKNKEFSEIEVLIVSLETQMELQLNDKENFKYENVTKILTEFLEIKNPEIYSPNSVLDKNQKYIYEAIKIFLNFCTDHFGTDLGSELFRFSHRSLLSKLIKNLKIYLIKDSQENWDEERKKNTDETANWFVSNFSNIDQGMNLSDDLYSLMKIMYGKIPDLEISKIEFFSYLAPCLEKTALLVDNIKILEELITVEKRNEVKDKMEIFLNNESPFEEDDYSMCPDMIYYDQVEKYYWRVFEILNEKSETQ